MKKVLTPDLIQAKTRCDNLFLIKNLNLWGNEIEDIRLLRQMPNLEILSLSVNRISSLKEFSNCKKLQELYLRKNNISDLEELQYLVGLQELRILWLLDNPCSENEKYREIVIKTLPNIKKLDNNEVTDEERKKAELLRNEGVVNFNMNNKQIKKEVDFVKPIENDFEYHEPQQSSPVKVKPRQSIHEEKFTPIERPQQMAPAKYRQVYIIPIFYENIHV